MPGSRQLKAFALLLVAAWLTPISGAGLEESAPTGARGRRGFTAFQDPAGVKSAEEETQASPRTLAPSQAITLRDDPSPSARAAAAESLGALGTPAALDALRTALREDPDPFVRAAAAESIGRIGPLALAALPDLILALDRTGTDGSVCLAASRALGGFGRSAIAAVRPLASAAAAGCGGAGDAPGQAITAIASDVSAYAGAQTSDELQAVLDTFRAIEDELGVPLPAGVLVSLQGIEGVIRSRSPNWLSEFGALLALLVGSLASALRSVGGILAAILAVALVIFGLRKAGRFLPAGLGERGEPRPFGWEWADVELWLKRPGGRVSRIQLTPSRITALLRKRAKEEGIVLADDDQVLEEHWDRFVGTVTGSAVPAFAAARWMKGVMEDAKEGRDLSPPGSMVEVVLGEIDARYVANPGAPPKDLVARAVQAVAWETMRGGSFTGWVQSADLRSVGPEPEVDILLEYAEKEMDFVKRDPRRRRVRLSTDEDITARLGSLHLMERKASSATEVLGHLGALQTAAIQKVGRAQAPAFLRTVAGAMLEAANALEEKGPDLGIAEEALMELAEVRKGADGSGGSGPAGAGRAGGRSREVGRSGELGVSREGGDPGALPPRGAGGSGGSESVRLKRLLERLQSEHHPAVRERILGAIGEMGPAARPALPALMDSVERDPAGVAVVAVEALGNIGPGAERAAPLLVETMERGHLDIRLAATRALGRMGPAGAAAAPILMEWTSQGGVPHELRARAAEALGGMPTEADASIPALAELLRSEVASEVRAAAALALARLDTGRRDVEEVLRWAHRTPDPALRGMVGIALLVRDRRLGPTPKPRGATQVSDWLAPMAISAGALTILELGALVGTQFLTPGSVLPALFVTPALAFLAGIAYGVATRRLPAHPALGGGVTGWAGASAGLLIGLLFSAALSPLALVAGGGLALGSGAFGGLLVRTALAEL